MAVTVGDTGNRKCINVCNEAHCKLSMLNEYIVADIFVVNVSYTFHEIEVENARKLNIITKAFSDTHK